MSETVNQEINATAAEPEKTFTQTEVNAILGERLAREKANYADYEMLKEKAEKFDAAEEASKTELQKATERADALQKQLDRLNSEAKIREIRDKVSKETGIPADMLYGDDEETCKEQAEKIINFKPGTYPSTKEIRDGGEVTKLDAKSGATRDQFAEWFEKTTRRT